MYGKAEDKELTKLIPGILSQLGPESLASLRKLAESYQALSAQHGAAQGADGDDVPDVKGNFDEVEKAPEADQLD